PPSPGPTPASLQPPPGSAGHVHLHERGEPPRERQRLLTPRRAGVSSLSQRPRSPLPGEVDRVGRNRGASQTATRPDLEHPEREEVLPLRGLFCLLRLG